MQGRILYPLNKLKDQYPGIYSKKAAKYQDREGVQERVIPHLNCRWNDVLFLCPVYPGKIIGKLREIGYSYPAEKFYEIDTGLLTHDKIAVLTYPGNGIEPQYLHQSPACMPGISELPVATEDYFKDCYAQKKRFLLFAYIPHVLYLGNVNTEHCPIVEC